MKSCGGQTSARWHLTGRGYVVYTYRMNIHIIFGVFGVLLSTISAFPYIKSIIYGTTKPNAVSFGLWYLQALIDITATASGGSIGTLLFVIISASTTAVVFILSLTGYGYREYGYLDFLCGALTLFAIIGWYYTGDPRIALVFSIFAGTCTALPTLIKTYKEPDSEYYPAWFIFSMGALCAIFSMTDVNFASLAISCFVFVEGMSIAMMALLVPLLRVRHNHNPHI